MIIKPYSDTSRFTSTGDSYPSLTNYPGLVHLWHKSHGVVSGAGGTWTDMIAGVVMASSDPTDDMFQAGAEGSILTNVTSGTLGLTGTVVMPKLTKNWIGIAVSGSSTGTTWKVGGTTVAEAKSGVRFTRSESNATTMEFMGATPASNYLSSYNTGAANTMAYTAAAAAMIASVDMPNSTYYRVAGCVASSEQWTINATTVQAPATGTNAGTITGTPFASDVTNVVNPVISLPQDTHLFAIFNLSKSMTPTFLQQCAAWMSATGNRGYLYPGLRGIE